MTKKAIKGKEKISKKAISLLILIITIVVILIIAGTTIVTVMKQNSLGNAKLAALETDLKAMVDAFNTKYDQAVYQYRGDVSKIQVSDIGDIIPAKYQDDFRVSVAGVEYTGNDTQILSVAKDLGILIPNGVVEFGIKNLHLNSTTNSFTVSVILKHEIEDTVTYALSYRNVTTGGSWIPVAMGENSTKAVSNLPEENTFEVKVKATNTNTGEVVESEVVKVITKDFVEGDVILRAGNINGSVYTPNTWINQSVSIELKKSENATTTYSIMNGGKTVVDHSSENMIFETQGESELVVTTTDGTTTRTKSYLIKIDKEKPVGTFEIVETTSNAITVKVTNIQEKLSGIREYAFYIDGALKVIQTDPQYTFGKLTQATSHQVEVKIRDNAINESTYTKDAIKTDSVLDGQGNITYMLSPPSWSNVSVLLQVEYDKAGTKGLVPQYSEDGQNFVDVTAMYEKEYTTNRKVYARYRDSENQYGTRLEITIWNMDKLPPTVSMNPNGGKVFEIPVGKTTAPVEVTLNATDQEATSQYGKSDIASLQYAWSSDSRTEPTTWKTFNNGQKITEELGGGNHYLWTRVLDRAGNRAETIKVSNLFEGRYRVEYHANGGTGTTPAYQQKVWNVALALQTSNLSKTGYTNEGWNTKADGTGTTYVAGGSYTDNASILLYTKWRANTYTIKYNGNGENGGSTLDSSHTYDVAKTLTPNGYTRKFSISYVENYDGGSIDTIWVASTFAGWNSKADGTGTNYADKQSVVNLASADGAVVNLYAKWNPGSTVLRNATRPGYIFGGWYADAACTRKVGDAGATYTPTGLGGLYAKWTINTYTVSYHANGGSGQPGNQTKTYGVNLALSGTKPTRAGYTFVNWNTEPDGKGTAYAAGGTYTNNANVTLYAIWKINTYTVKYSGNGWQGADDIPKAQTKIYGKTLYLDSHVPIATIASEGVKGRSFICWNTDPDGKGTNYDAGAAYKANENVTLYAQWDFYTNEIQTYEIVYNSNGGSTPPRTQIKKYNTDINLRSEIPLRPGYMFVHWNTKSDDTGTSYNSGQSYTKNADVKLYAIWKTCPKHEFGESFNSISKEFPNYDNSMTYREAYAMWGEPNKQFGFAWVCTAGHNHWMEGNYQASVRICVHCAMTAGAIGGDRFWCPIQAGLGGQ